MPFPSRNAAAAPRAAVRAGGARAVVGRRGAAAAARATVVDAPAEAGKSNYAVIEVGGHQSVVEEGRFYTSNRLNGTEVGDTVEFKRVLLAKDQGAGKLHMGEPYVEDVTVVGEIVDHFKGKKVLVQKYKPKKHYKRRVGHRQHLTKFVVKEINYGS